MKLTKRISILNTASVVIIAYMVYQLINPTIQLEGDGLSKYFPAIGITAGILGLVFDQILQANIRSKARLFVIEVGVIMLCVRGLIFILENNAA